MPEVTRQHLEHVALQCDWARTLARHGERVSVAVDLELGEWRGTAEARALSGDQRVLCRRWAVHPGYEGRLALEVWRKYAEQAWRSIAELAGVAELVRESELAAESVRAERW